MDERLRAFFLLFPRDRVVLERVPRGPPAWPASLPSHSSDDSFLMVQCKESTCPSKGQHLKGPQPIRSGHIYLRSNADIPNARTA
jgi:hypothetical protein